ncbi:bifunctional metallophosphatase/5'-nucleotidase [Paenibacillus sp. GCM10027626]|uniref:bifunctional metallophosphatase/5'-nucleotidase n=1 Tax=Paenibacillus sp. GCM10027626 TaxID=3273411 RepID=UPI00362AC1C0
MSNRGQDAPVVVLLHSNDVHSRLEQAAKMSSYIADTRRELGCDHVLVVDIGDHMDRMRPETEGSDGEVNIALLNAAGYEAVTLGNNEGLTFTAEQLEEKLGKQAKFIPICANMKLIGRDGTSSRPEWLQPSAIVQKSGLAIGLIGVTAAFANFYTLLGWDASDPLAAVREQVAAMREQADVVVIMSHLGLPLDRMMAEQIDGIDLILGGHTHHLLEEPERINGTLVCAAGKFGEYIGRVEIRMPAGHVRPQLTAACIPVSAYEEHPEAAEIIAGYKNTAAERLNRVIVHLSEPLPFRNGQESPLANMLASGLRRWTGAEIGLVNAGQLLGGLAVGDVTEGELHALCPSPINPCRMKLTGQAIKEALEQSLLPDYIEKPIRGFGFRGSVLGTLAVDGLAIAWNPAREPDQKIVAIEVNGQPLEAEREYIVGTIDMFTFGIGYESIKTGTDIQYYLPEFIRGVLAEQLKSSTAIQDSHLTRWRIINP